MDIFKYMFDNEYKQRNDIDDLRARNESVIRRARTTHYKTAKLEDRIKELENDLGELALINKTLLQMLIENNTITKPDFESTLKKLDLEDGVEDGKLTKPEPEPEPEQIKITPRPIGSRHKKLR